MRNFTRLFFTGLMLLLFSNYGIAQLNPKFTTVIGKLIRTTPRLADIDNTSMYGVSFPKKNKEREREKAEEINSFNTRKPVKTDFGSKVLNDMALQPSTPSPTAASAIINQNFDGLFAPGFAPSDNNLAVGPNHVIQIINFTRFQIYNKAGTPIGVPINLSSITGISSQGDPVVMYDQIADRWVLTEFSGANINTLVFAVSTTSDPTGAYKIYSYTFPYSADYPHYSVWHNAYYGITHDFQPGYVGSSIYAFDRAAMIAGAATATVVSFRFDNTVGPNVANRSFTMLPVHQEGPAVSNQSGLFSFFQDDSETGDPLDVDSVFTFTYTPNFTTPSSSVIGPMLSVVAAPFNSTLCGAAACITQPAGGPAIRGIEGQLMHKVSYRNFGAYESMVANFTTNAGSGIGGIRWWELRRTGGAGNWSMYQQGTYAPPDGNHRFMGSIAQNSAGDIGMIFNVTGPGTPPTFPSFRLTGRVSCDPLGQMTIPETSIIEGTIINGTNRMGDYNAIQTDPSSNTFWGTGQYNKPGLGTFGNWATRVVNFSIAGGGAQVTSQPSSVTVCAGTTASFAITAVGGAPLGYQWQVSINGGGSWADIAGATSPGYSFTAVAGDNGNQYRCKVTSACPIVAISNAATLTITTFSQGGSIAPAAVNACAGTNSTTLTLSGFIGNIIQWESSIDGGTTWSIIANTTTTLTATNITTTTLYRALVQSSGCSAAYSAISTITFVAASVGQLTIVTDNGTTLCAGDPTLLTALGITSFTFTSPGAITIPSSGPGNPYPSNLVVSGVPVTGVPIASVKISGISHTWGNDVDILLQSPTGTNVVLMSDIGGTVAIPNATYTFSDAAAANLNPGAANATGTYKPTNNGATDTWIAPGPGTITQATPALSMFTGDPNGTWKLFVVDDTGGDQGSISGGYSITFTSAPVIIPGLTYVWSPAAGLNATNTNPVAASPSASTTYTVVATNGSGCTGTASIAITVNQRPKVTTQPLDISICNTSSVSFSVTATGTGISYQWQESTNGGLSYTSLVNAIPYSGVATPTLTVNPVSVAMNNNLYRCVISGICTPAANSNGAKLTVIALPAVSVTPIAGCGGVAGTNGLLLTASGANTYTWSPVAGLYTDAAATIAYVAGANTATVYASPKVFTSYTVAGTNTATGCIGFATANINYTPPAPNVTPVAVAMCLGDAAVRLTSSSSTTTTVSFSSGAISVPVPDNNPAGVTTNLAVAGIPANANVSAMRVTFNMTHTWNGDMVFVLKAPNGNILNLDYYLSGTGGAGATSGFVNTVVSSTGTATLSSGSGTYTAIFRPDAQVAAGGFGQAGPTGYLPNVNNYNQLYSTPNGTYTLAMYDGGPADLGILTSWSLGITYVLGVPATPAVWSPIAGLYTDAGALIPYTGTPLDTVYAKPTPSGVYPYTATVNSVPVPGPSNPASITIPSSGTGTPYPSNITVSGYPVTGVSVTNVVLTGVSHTWGDDIDILLQSPTGQNVVLMSDVGGTVAVPNATYTFSDAGPAMSFGSVNPTGTYKPTNNGATDTWPAPGPGSVTQAAPALSLFGSVANVNGNWKLFVVDDTGGDQGVISGGWSINFDYAFPSCTSPARTVVVTVNQPISITAQPVNAAVCTDKVTSFTVSAAGTTPTYQWQVSTDVGNTWNNVSNGGVYAGVTTTTLTISAPPVSMNGYFYRCVVSGASPCAPVNTAQRTLTVNPLPTITIGASPYKKLFPGLTTTLFSTVSPAAQPGAYTWLRNGIAVPGANASSLIITVDGLGDYRLRVTDINGCTNTSNEVSLSDSASGRVFIYPNPNGGQFQVRYYSIINNTRLPRGINVYDARGKRVVTQTYSIGSPYARMDVDLRTNGTGVYWIEVVDVTGNRLAMGRAEVLR